ncbi:ras association domain-containing protein 7-like [Salvelinus namaycush]|uniref:Ras association domain-containing protein 7-like n=1 Tax=Salvelinus namaycush TaxID=8040 RepID=A0A8U0TRJ6_SALNM|nr:ras association domain-containing protein 7-like [Salvelinus namaycush]
MVIALTQAIGQTDRYVLIQKLRGTERQHVADDCPLGSLSGCQESKKALTFNLGPSTIPRRTNANKSDPSKKKVFRQVLQQQEMLQDLEAQLVALERETEVWEMGRHATPLPGLNPGLGEELDVLETRLRQNGAELMHVEYCEEQMQREKDKEQDIQGRLRQLYASMDEYSFRLKDLQTHSFRLGQDFCVEAQRRSSHPGTPQSEEAMGALREELHNRHQKGRGARRERCQVLEKLNKK